MRRLTKGPLPSSLAANSAAWTAEYAAAVASGHEPLRRWRDPEVVEALRDETKSKCAYCESLIVHVSYPHVEHIRPKSKRPDLVVEWSNLTIGCPVCNTNKGDYYDEGAPLAHPYEHSVEEHITFRGPMIVAQPGSDIGERTITRLDLRRGALFIERMKRLEALHLLIDRLARSSEPDRPVYEKLVTDAVADGHEFVSCLREYATSMGFQPTLIDENRSSQSEVI